jgi:hypothetical protein
MPRHASTDKYQALGVQTFLPMMAFEFGVEVLLHGPADTEIGNQGPAFGHIEDPRQYLRLKDRNPAKPQSLGTRRQP